MGADPADTLIAFREAIEHWSRMGNRTQQWVTVRNLLPVLVHAGHDELACMVHGGLQSAPVRLPADVAVAEAAALTAAVAEATKRLGEGPSTEAARRGGRMSLDELASALLPALRPAGEQPGQAASIR